MKTSKAVPETVTVSRKLGANRNEAARRARRRDANFSQSRDVREDRGQRQAQTARPRRTLARSAGRG